MRGLHNVVDQFCTLSERNIGYIDVKEALYIPKCIEGYFIELCDRY